MCCLSKGGSTLIVHYGSASKRRVRHSKKVVTESALWTIWAFAPFPLSVLSFTGTSRTLGKWTSDRCHKMVVLMSFLSNQFPSSLLCPLACSLSLMFYFSLVCYLSCWLPLFFPFLGSVCQVSPSSSSWVPPLSCLSGMNCISGFGSIAFFFFSLFWMQAQHMEVPGPGIKSELQLQPTPQPLQCWIFNPLRHSRNSSYLFEISFWYKFIPFHHKQQQWQQ